jgi:hypothetical protein
MSLFFSCANQEEFTADVETHICRGTNYHINDNSIELQIMNSMFVEEMDELPY